MCVYIYNYIYIYDLGQHHDYKWDSRVLTISYTVFYHQHCDWRRRSEVINLSAASMGCSILALPRVFAVCGMCLHGRECGGWQRGAKEKDKAQKAQKGTYNNEDFCCSTFFGGGLLVCGVRSGKIDQLKQVWYAAWFATPVDDLYRLRLGLDGQESCWEVISWSQYTQLSDEHPQGMILVVHVGNPPKKPPVLEGLVYTIVNLGWFVAFGLPCYFSCWSMLVFFFLELWHHHHHRCYWLSYLFLYLSVSDDYCKTEEDPYE